MIASRLDRATALVLASLTAAIAAAAVVANAASPTVVGADAAMYGAVATSLGHGLGLVLPDGAVVVDRPPLFAASVTALAAVAGVVPAEILVAKLGFVALVAVSAWLAARIGGWFAGLLVAIGFGVSPLLVRWTGATLIDGLAAALAMAAIVALTGTAADGRRWALAGLLLGLSFWVKETAIFLLFVPVGLAIVGPGSARARADAAGAMIATFIAASSPWFVWVALQTGRTYLVGLPAIVAAAGLVAAVAVAWLVRSRLSSIPPTQTARLRPWIALGILAAVWVVGGWAALELAADQGAPGFVVRAIYRYGRLTLAPDLPLLLAILAAGGVGLAVAIRREPYRPVALAVVATAPILPFVALRGWEARNLAILIASMIVLAAAIAATASVALMRRRRGLGLTLGAGLLLAVTAVSIGPTLAALHRQPARAASATWDQPGVAATAAWLERRIPAGATIVASWQYAAMLYVDAGAAFRVRQVPLVRVAATDDPAQPLVRIATFDSWQDRRLPHDPTGPLVYLHRGVPGDWVALERSTLQAALDDTGSPVLVVVGGGPAQRSGENYPFVGSALGAGDPVLDLETGPAWIRIFGLPPGATYQGGLVSLDPPSASQLMTGDPNADRQALDAIGATAVRIWPSTGLPAATLEQLRQAGQSVVVAGD